MNANINEGELKLLAYLHENAEGYTQQFPFDPGLVASALGIDMGQLKKDSSYLADHGLAGIITTEFFTPKGSAFELLGIWVTGRGEDYMREIEERPGVGKRVTVSVVKEMGAGLRSIAVAVLTDLASRKL